MVHTSMITVISMKGHLKKGPSTSLIRFVNNLFLRNWFMYITFIITIINLPRIFNESSKLIITKLDRCAKNFAFTHLLHLLPNHLKIIMSLKTVLQWGIKTTIFLRKKEPRHFRITFLFFLSRGLPHTPRWTSSCSPSSPGNPSSKFLIEPAKITM